WIQCTVPLARWVSPFGHRRLKACCQLPDAFRRLPRPPSPLTARASTVSASSLVHITSKRLHALSHTGLRPSCHAPSAANPRLAPAWHRPCAGSCGSAPRFEHLIGTVLSSALASPTRCRQFVPNARYVPSCQRTRQGHNAPPLKSLVCAVTFNSPPSVVEPVGIEPTTPCLQSRCSPS